MNGNENLVVLGGSFAPMTQAHGELLARTCRYLGNVTGRLTKGVFVPSSDAYVKRKLEKLGEPDSAFWSSWNAIRKEAAYGVMDCFHKDLSIDTYELDNKDARGSTLKTLDYLARKHPGAEIYFILGADKLEVFQKWKTARDILSRYRILISPRDGVDGGYPKVPGFEERYVELLDYHLKGSSTDVRKYAREGAWDAVWCQTCAKAMYRIASYYINEKDGRSMERQKDFATAAADIRAYLETNLPDYELIGLWKKSSHPDDWYLYKAAGYCKKDGTYAVWNSWNESTQSLNHGAYQIPDWKSCQALIAKGLIG